MIFKVKHVVVTHEGGYVLELGTVTSAPGEIIKEGNVISIQHAIENAMTEVSGDDK